MKNGEYFMKFKTLMLGALAVAGFATAEYVERDYQEIEEFSASQRKEITHLGTGELMIGGDVRVEMKRLYEKYDGIQKYGSEGFHTNALPVANTQWDVDVNLILDHRTEKTWAHAKIEFDNNMGTGETFSTEALNEDYRSGTDDSISLEQAYFGINLMEDGASRLDFEVGRNFGTNWFSSLIQFDNRMDGAFFKYSNSFEGIGDSYLKVGTFLVSEKVDYYATVGEAGIMDIANTGAYVKYSYIDWTKSSIPTADNNFRNSQATIGMVMTPEYLAQPINYYAAFLVNHAAERGKVTPERNKKDNLGWYAGMSVGNVEKAGDWYVNADYQYVGAQAVMDSDVSGIGIGNVDNAWMYKDAHGNANYKGYELQALYAVTDSLSLSAEWQDSSAAKKSVDTPSDHKKHTFRKFELEAIYAF